jgi:amino acid transporter
VFWTFFLMTALTLFIFRRKESAEPLFRVPLYPVIPLLFVAACLYMLYSSINYVRFAVSFGVPVIAGIAIMAAGIPLYFLAKRK